VLDLPCPALAHPVLLYLSVTRGSPYFLTGKRGADPVD